MYKDVHVHLCVIIVIPPSPPFLSRKLTDSEAFCSIVFKITQVFTHTISSSKLAIPARNTALLLLLRSSVEFQPPIFETTGPTQ